MTTMRTIFIFLQFKCKNCKKRKENHEIDIIDSFTFKFILYTYIYKVFQLLIFFYGLFYTFSCFSFKKFSIYLFFFLCYILTKYLFWNYNKEKTTDRRTNNNFLKITNNNQAITIITTTIIAIGKKICKIFKF